VTAKTEFTVSTHVLDTSRGSPASGIDVALEQVLPNGESTVVGRGTTNVDGRIPNLLDTSMSTTTQLAVSNERTTLRLRFDTASYLSSTSFYPEVVVSFTVDMSDPRRHYHIPLLLSPFGYSTYRGS
jgi:5-hydroxyisourate hydrolase